MDPEIPEPNATELIRLGEGDTIELKKSFAETDTALRALAAFASLYGGTVLFGVAPNGKVHGLQIGDDSLERLAQAIQSRIEPRIYPRVVDHPLEGGRVCSVTVRPDGRIHSADGRYYTRVGRTTQQLTTDELKKRLMAELSTQARGAKRPDIRVGFFTMTNPTELLDRVTLYPMWPDGPQHSSTVIGVAVRTYNGGDGTARKLLLTFQLPPRVAPWSVTGYKTDMTAAIRGYRDAAVYTYNVEGLNPGVQITNEFFFTVWPGMSSFYLEFSVAMEDERAVSGRLLVELNQLAAPNRSITGAE